MPVPSPVESELGETTKRRERVVVAGASGFVGRALIAALAKTYDVVALARSAEGRPTSGPIEWRACDLFRLRDTEAALAGADMAFYLVHSMMPSARLTQGNFDDLDLLCADNFARAAKKAGIRHIVYLGGLLPELDADLSKHLESRFEVERTLAARGTPVTTLRAGMVVGAGGSSFRLMMRLVKRLPILVGPRWMSSRSQAIALNDAVALLQYALEHAELAGQAYDIGANEVHTYAEMLTMMAEVLGKPKRVVTLPVATAKLSLLWVSLVTGTSRDLVRPLIESLKHDMVAGDGLRLQARAGIKPESLRSALQTAASAERDLRATTPSAPSANGKSLVCSVQRLPLPTQYDAEWVADEYARWLPAFMAPFLRVTVDAEKTCKFYLRPLSSPLLVLEFARDRSGKDRQLYRVTGGLLARTPEASAKHHPRLEFRSVLEGASVLSAIHDFEPKLPWIIYTISQALVHLLRPPPRPPDDRTRQGLGTSKHTRFELVRVHSAGSESNSEACAWQVCTYKACSYV
jgi:uncharacterized protein YbjT (DUF2867 family)